MNFEKLKNSLVDTIAEQQLKIGYQKTVLSGQYTPDFIVFILFCCFCHNHNCMRIH